MALSLGGLIFRNASQVQDEEILTMLRYNNFGYSEPIKMENASEESTRGIVLTRPDDLLLVLGRDIPHGCSFEKDDELSRIDKSLAEFSRNGDVLVFLAASSSDTYAYSVFRDGKRVRGMVTSAGKLLSAWGETTGYETTRGNNEAGVVEVIEKFTGMKLSNLLSHAGEVTAYYK